MRFPLLVILLLISACSSLSSVEVKPWVKPYERQNLAKEVMKFDRDPVSSAYMRHVYQAREGARGAEGGSGGGCGCN